MFIISENNKKNFITRRYELWIKKYERRYSMIFIKFKATNNNNFNPWVDAQGNWSIEKSIILNKHQHNFLYCNSKY
jgi:hypothetical protein